MYGTSFGHAWHKFETFVEVVFDPLTRDVAPDPVRPEEEEYKIESIQQKRGRGDTLQYKVKYEWYGNKHNRWLDAAELDECEDLIKEFLEKQRARQQGRETRKEPSLGWRTRSKRKARRRRRQLISHYKC